MVVPTFNRAPLISETLDCVLGQTAPPTEVIVIDDGSIDDTESVVARYGAAVRYIKIKNGGPPNARSVGVAAATQPWIALCDSDDFWRPGYLRQISALVSREPGCEFIFSNFSLVTEGVWGIDKFSTLPRAWWDAIGAEAVGEGLQIARGPLYPFITQFQPIVPSAMAFTRRFFDAVGGCNPAFGRNRSEDTEFVLRCVREAPTGILTKPLVGIRRHEGNFTAEKFAVCRGRLEVVKFALENHAVSPEWRRALFAERDKLTVEAFDGAFEQSDMAVARALSGEVPRHALSLRRRLKKAIASLPSPVSENVSRWIQRARPSA